jgi:hypothetical protein
LKVLLNERDDRANRHDQTHQHCDHTDGYRDESAGGVCANSSVHSLGPRHPAPGTVAIRQPSASQMSPNNNLPIGGSGTNQLSDRSRYSLNAVRFAEGTPWCDKVR